MVFQTIFHLLLCLSIAPVKAKYLVCFGRKKRLLYKKVIIV